MSICQCSSRNGDRNLYMGLWESGHWQVRLADGAVSGLWIKVYDRATGHEVFCQREHVRGLPCWVFDKKQLNDPFLWEKAVRALDQSGYIKVICASGKVAALEYVGQLMGGMQSSSSDAESLSADDQAKLKEVMDDDNDLTCVICQELYKDPVSASDGYLYCRGCLEQFLKTSRPVSPYNREELLDIPLVTSRDAVNRVIAFIDRTIQKCKVLAPQFRSKGYIRTALSVVERGLELIQLTTARLDSKVDLLKEKVILSQLRRNIKEAIEAKIVLAKCLEEKKNFSGVVEVLMSLVEGQPKPDSRAVEMLIKAYFELKSTENCKTYILLLASCMVREGTFIPCEQLLMRYPTVCDQQVFEGLLTTVEGLANRDRLAFEMILRVFIQLQKTAKYQKVVIDLSSQLLNEKAYADCEKLLEQYRGLKNAKVLENLAEAKKKLDKHVEAAGIYEYLGDQELDSGALKQSLDWYEKAEKSYPGFQQVLEKQAQVIEKLLGDAESKRANAEASKLAYQLALLYRKMGMNVRYEAFLERAVSLDGQNEVAFKAYQSSCELRGEYTKVAKVCLSRVVENCVPPESREVARFNVNCAVESFDRMVGALRQQFEDFQLRQMAEFEARMAEATAKLAAVRFLPGREFNWEVGKVIDFCSIEGDPRIWIIEEGPKIYALNFETGKKESEVSVTVEGPFFPAPVFIPERGEVAIPIRNKVQIVSLRNQVTTQILSHPMPKQSRGIRCYSLGKGKLVSTVQNSSNEGTNVIVGDDKLWDLEAKACLKTLSFDKDNQGYFLSSLGNGSALYKLKNELKIVDLNLSGVGEKQTSIENQYVEKCLQDYARYQPENIKTLSSEKIGIAGSRIQLFSSDSLKDLGAICLAQDREAGFVPTLAALDQFLVIIHGDCVMRFWDIDKLSCIGSFHLSRVIRDLGGFTSMPRAEKPKRVLPLQNKKLCIYWASETDSSNRIQIIEFPNL